MQVLGGLVLEALPDLGGWNWEFQSVRSCSRDCERELFMVTAILRDYNCIKKNDGEAAASKGRAGDEADSDKLQQDWGGDPGEAHVGDVRGGVREPGAHLSKE